MDIFVNIYAIIANFVYGIMVIYIFLIRNII
jgi:hypothetical protein